MRMVLKSLPFRIVALSATIPNINNLALWLGTFSKSLTNNHISPVQTPAKIIKFPDSMRPIPLKTHVIAASMQGKNGFTFDYSLNYKLPEVLSKYSDKKPVLIVILTFSSDTH